ALIGLFELAARSGGATGRGVVQAVEQVVGVPGAWVLLTAGLLIGLIVTVHFSPGALILTVVRAARAAFAERGRLERLVSPPGSTPAPAPKAARVSNDALARSAASFATPHPTVEQAPLWHVDEPEDQPVEPLSANSDGDEEPAKKPSIHVVAEPEDDIPDIDWKLPSIALLDTVTARRGRMAGEVKANGR